MKIEIKLYESDEDIDFGFAESLHTQYFNNFRILPSYGDFITDAFENAYRVIGKQFYDKTIVIWVAEEL